MNILSNFSPADGFKGDGPGRRTLTFCPQCGKPVALEDTFCTACGMQVSHVPFPGSVAPQRIAPSGRPPGVGIIAGTMIVLGAIILLLFVGGMYLAYTGAEGWNDVVAQSAIQLERSEVEVVPILWAAMFVGATFAAASIVAGIGALRAKRWAWTLMMAFMALNGLGAIFELPSATGFIGILVSAIVVWYFLRPDVKRYFGRS